MITGRINQIEPTAEADSSGLLLSRAATATT